MILLEQTKTDEVKRLQALGFAETKEMQKRSKLSFDAFRREHKKLRWVVLLETKQVDEERKKNQKPNKVVVKSEKSERSEILVAWNDDPYIAGCETYLRGKKKA